MFVEVPSINNVKKSDLFEIIKTKTNMGDNVEYYPINDDLVYALDNREYNNMIAAKLMRKVLEKGSFKDFAIINITKVLNSETDEVEEKLAITLYEKEEISYDVLDIEKSPILTMVMNLFDNEDVKILYIENEELETIIEEVVEITGIDEDIFIGTNGDVSEEDFSLLVTQGSMKNQILDVKNSILKMFKDENGESKISKSHIIIAGSLLAFVLISGGGYYAFDSYQQKIAMEKAQAELALKKKKKVNTQKKLQNNLLKADTLIRLINKYDIQNFNNIKNTVDLKMSYDNYTKGELSKVKIKEKFILGDTVLLKNIKLKDIQKMEKIEKRKESDLESMNIKLDYFALANEMNGMYFETSKKEFVFKTKLNKNEINEGLIRIMFNNKSNLNISLVYLKGIEKYSILINATKVIPPKPKPVPKKPTDKK